MNCCDEESGFTVLEALVAFMIMLLVSLALLRGMAQVLDYGGRASERLEAAVVARTILNSYGVNENTSKSGTVEGGFSWEIKQRPAANESGGRKNIVLTTLSISTGRSEQPLFVINAFELAGRTD